MCIGVRFSINQCGLSPVTAELIAAVVDDTDLEVGQMCMIVDRFESLYQEEFSL